MKGQRKRPAHRKQPADRPSTSIIEGNAHPNRTVSRPDALLQNPGVSLEGTLAVIASSSTSLPLPYGQNRGVHEQENRNTLEDKIRQTIDSWTAEEQATAYWYLYASGMTLERAKSIRHKSGFGT